MGGVSRGVGGARGRVGVVLSAQARVSPQRSVPAVPGPTRVRRREGGRLVREVREVRTVVRADGLRLRRGAWGGRLRVRSGPAQAAPPPPPPRRGPSRHQMGAPLEGPKRTRRKCGVLGGSRARRGVSVLVGAEAARPLLGGSPGTKQLHGGRKDRAASAGIPPGRTHQSPSEPQKRKTEETRKRSKGGAGLQGFHRIQMLYAFPGFDALGSTTENEQIPGEFFSFLYP
uniref:uncharacterized protein LOC132689629 n=1 Tax=Panthera onca TaxID=9690 RepID=UPI002953108B|nr:uncharacterized protein LOC132689629 [Panthera onca]